MVKSAIFGIFFIFTPSETHFPLDAPTIFLVPPLLKLNVSIWQITPGRFSVGKLKEEIQVKLFYKLLHLQILLYFSILIKGNDSSILENFFQSCLVFSFSMFCF